MSPPTNTCTRLCKPGGSRCQPSTTLRMVVADPTPQFGSSQVSRPTAARACAVVGNVETSPAILRASPLLAETTCPRLLVSTRTVNLLGSALGLANGPIVTGSPEPPMQSAPHTGA